jgi:phenylpropionate dioxygenase-like ring-hydroxylating dioxygenase large terminal subunit
MLNNFWYAVEFSNEIDNKPQLIQLLVGEASRQETRQIVLYRTTDGKIQAIANTCIHRGAALVNGWTKGNCIVCPYHGWEYQPDGTCTNIPSHLPGMTIPKQAQMKTYPVQDKYGWIWLYLGEGVPPELPAIADFPQDRRRRSIQGEFNWQANYERVIENGLDFAHAPFVHAGAFGNPDAPEVAELTIDNFGSGASATVLLKATPPKGLWKLLAKGERAPIKTRTGFILPNLTFLEVSLPFGTLTIWTAHVPIDLDKTVSKWINFRDFFTGKWADKDAYNRTIKIFEQDKPIVESQRPQIIPIDLNAELFVPADGLQLQYRKLRQQALTAEH